MLLKIAGLILSRQFDISSNPEIYPHPDEVILTRPLESYHFVGYSPHQALGSRLSRMVLVEMFKAVASLKQLRLTPGDSSSGLKVVKGDDGLGNEKYLDGFQSQYGPFPTELSVMFNA